MLICQINNIHIRKQDEKFVCVGNGRTLEEFHKLTSARKWAETTHDFLTPVAMEREIAGAWRALRRALRLPKLENRNIVEEHEQWWVIGYDEEEQLVTYSVVEASGPNTFNGLSFEEV